MFEDEMEEHFDALEEEDAEALPLANA